MNSQERTPRIADRATENSFAAAWKQMTLALRLVRALGPVQGASALLQFAFGTAPVALRLRGYPAPLFARRGTGDFATFEKVFLQREYDFDRLGVDVDPALVIDAGANVGYAAVFFARRYPQARVLALEPEASNYALLRRNVQAYPNVTPLRAALWKAEGRLQVSNPDDAKPAIQVQASRDGAIDAVTVPDLLERAGRARVDLLKMDIEGSEKELFEDGAAAAWLGRVGVIAIELHDRLRPGCSRAFYQAVDRRPSSRHRHGEHVVVDLRR